MSHREALEALRLAYPALTYQNRDYDEIPRAVKDANAEGIAKIEAILKEAVADFVRFQNFRLREDGTVTVRCQTRWSPYFTGVSYIPLEDFK